MNTPFYLAMPRLHTEFLPNIKGCRTLWPGLPSRPETAWEPVMPMSSAMAAACLADYERVCRDGAHGTPVVLPGADFASSGLSEAETRALREMVSLPVEDAAFLLRQQAQQMLLLVWLKEGQALEMAALEHKIKASRKSLAEVISGGTSSSESLPVVDEEALPDWKHSLSAALAFLADFPENTVVVVTHRAMAETLSACGMPHSRGEKCEESQMVDVPVADLAALCGHTVCKKLEESFSSEQWQRTITFLLQECLG